MDIEQPYFDDTTHTHGAASAGDAPIPLHRKLECLSSIQSESCIFRVHKHLREVKKDAYEPEIIAIGPYHRNKENVLMMEEHKLRYLHSLLQLKNENVERYLLSVRPLEREVRDFYAEPLTLHSNEIAEMMVLDGCFIIQLVLKFHMRSLIEKNDPIFKLPWRLNSLQRDLLLFENQIPFFILSVLFGLIGFPKEEILIDFLLSFLAEILPDPLHRPLAKQYANGKVKHLVDLVHMYWEPSLGGVSNRDNYDGQDGNTMPCATELREAGVELKRKEAADSFFHIGFKDGILQIPPLFVKDRTESFLRNLIAYEQYCGSSCAPYVTHYVTFLDCLINSSEDVELLCHRGIVQNYLGDNEVVAGLFSKISDSVTVLMDDFHYAGIFKSVNGYCNKRRNRWMANLRRNHLNSPWAVISIVAAGILLLLTLTQTIFTVFPGK